ncbi:MAG: hypothetical protein E6G59_09630 [Actinobacteria bacterium]|nr:MAG: hypothetical protein E6G59_09630 [Actinomycetota bacterium]TMK80323.1 MAG: hypothetical protein E6G46_09460 [Actinomycetota bacterium]TML79055.1 MAG: hypothetical protein E6G04_06730 [Actinomycetota bacterium]
MIPLPEILAELVMALGGALLAANAWALLRPVVRPSSPGPGRAPARSKVLINMAIGLVVFVWGLASFITRAHH